jgi:hypothetical protein
MTGCVVGARCLVWAGSVPALGGTLGIAVVERPGRFRKDAEQQPGMIAHYRPGVHLLYQRAAELLQPGCLGG